MFSSFELVKSMLPAEHHKVLANIRKAEARTKRKKQVSEQDDSQSEEEAPKTKGERLDHQLLHINAPSLIHEALSCLITSCPVL